MNIGALDRKIMIKYPLSVRDSFGRDSVTWTELGSFWSTMKYPTNAQGRSEGLEQGRETATIPVEFTIWYVNTIDETMRVEFEGDVFEIKRVNRVGQRNEMLKLVTEKKV